MVGMNFKKYSMVIIFTIVQIPCMHLFLTSYVNMHKSKVICKMLDNPKSSQASHH
jgi:hypothetical protein